MRRAPYLALKQVVLGVGDLHGDGFANLNTIYTVFYGGYLQAFQTAIGWRQVRQTMTLIMIHCLIILHLYLIVVNNRIATI